jgi:hypothetical protein
MQPSFLIYYIFPAFLCYLIYELIRSHRMFLKVETPLIKHIRELNKQSNSKRLKIKHTKIQKIYYAYDQLSTEELILSKLFLKSSTNQLGYIEVAIKLIIKMIVPISIFFLGMTISASIAGRNTDSASQAIKMNDLILQVFSTSGYFIVSGLIIFTIALLNMIFRAYRKNYLLIYQLAIEEILNRKSEVTESTENKPPTPLL